MKKLVIFGITHLAEVAHFYFTHDSPYEVVAFTVHEAYLNQKDLLGLPVVSYEKIIEDYPPDDFSLFIAVGYKQVNSFRASIYNDAKQKGYLLPTYLSSRLVSWGETKIGDNCFILENQTIQPFVEIGNDVVVWSGNHIGHHVKIGDHCFITSHVVISGNVTVGDYSFLGVNATIRDGITIEKRSVIGAGTIILEDTRENSIYKSEQTKPLFFDHSKLKGF